MKRKPLKGKKTLFFKKQIEYIKKNTFSLKLFMKYQKYICIICGYIYDEAKGIPQKGIPEGTLFDDLPEDWVCPKCGATKKHFRLLDT